jgi:hypothetical protein
MLLALLEMARLLPSEAPDDQILGLVEEWIDRLAEERYDDALRLVAARSHWTPDLLRKVVEGYGLAEPHPSGAAFKVTSPRTARKSSTSPLSQNRRVQRWITPNPANAIGIVEYDLPLNGSWSDLTALFDLKLVGSELALELDDVHVL